VELLLLVVLVVREVLVVLLVLVVRLVLVVELLLLVVLVDELVVVVVASPAQAAFMTRLPGSDEVPVHGLPGFPVALYVSFCETRVPVSCVPMPAGDVPPLHKPR
jgi:hypothetical protein